MNRKHLFEIFCDIINANIVTVDHFNAPLMNKSIFFYLTDPKLLNAGVSSEQ